MTNLSTRLDTVRRMGLRQLTSRLQRRWRQRVVYPKKAAQLFPWPDHLPEGDAPFPFDERRAAALRPKDALLQVADDLVARRFTYLGLPTEDLGEPADWQRAPLGDPLWQYNLHYGQWAVDLLHAFLITDARRYRGTCIELVEDWLEGNPAGRQPAWDPYPICRRVVAWSRLAGALASGASLGRRFFLRRVEPSLRQQAAFLAANLEFDVPNNHLIANYKALAWLGLLFPHWPEAGDLKGLGLDGLWQEMRRQVLPDGVHDERSLSYHGIVLQDFLEVRWLAKQRGIPVPDDVDSTLRSMLRALRVTRMASGAWPATADSVVGYPCDLQSLYRTGVSLLGEAEASVGNGETAARETGQDAWYLGWLGAEGTTPQSQETPRKTSVPGTNTHLLPDAGWAVLRGSDGTSVFFDAGPLGPDAVLGHAHADPLSFELHAPSGPLLVDPGVCTYRAGELRDRFRSSAVHNTVTVDGENPCVFWGPFRVAHPPRVNLQASSGNVIGEHDGYCRLPHPVTHRRTVRWTDNGWEVHDELLGKGRHRFRSALQLAPGATLTLEDAPPGSPRHMGEARWPDGTHLELEILQGPEAFELNVESGDVSPSWNVVKPTPRWAITWRGHAPCHLTVRLRYSSTHEPEPKTP